MKKEDNAETGINLYLSLAELEFINSSAAYGSLRMTASPSSRGKGSRETERNLGLPKMESMTPSVYGNSDLESNERIRGIRRIYVTRFL